MWTLKGLVWTQCLCDALGGKSSETQALFCLLRHIPLHLTALEANFAQRLWLPPGTKVGLKKCCRLVDIFWNFNLIALAHRHLNSEGRPGVLRTTATFRKRPAAGTREMNSNNSRLSGSQCPKLNCPHTL